MTINFVHYEELKKELGKNIQPVEVIWMDAASLDGDHEPLESDNWQLLEMRTVAWLIECKEDRYIFAHTVRDDGNYQNIIVIPKENVKHIKYLGLEKEL